MKKIVLFSCIFCFLVIEINAQQLALRFSHITTKDGLSQSYITGFVQDKYGFIWIGTQDGLNRYDGNDFMIFRNDPSDPQSISDSYILSLYIDRNKNFWIGTETGLNLYDFSNEKFINFSKKTDPASTDITNYRTNVITGSLANPDLLWIGTNTGLYSFDIHNKSFDIHELPTINSEQTIHQRVNAICESASKPGILWIGTPNGLFRYNLYTKNILSYTEQNGLSGNAINCIFEDSKGQIWIGTDNGLNAFNEQNNSFKIYKNNPEDLYSLGSNFVNTIFEDKRNNLWVGTENGGLNLFNRNNEKFSRWINQPGNPISIADNSVKKIYEDKSGILWVCTNVINKVNTHFEEFGYFYHNPNDLNSISGNEIRSIIEDNKNQLWIGSNSGISIFDRKSGNYTHLKHDPNNRNSLSSNQTRVILQDRNENIWIGTRDAGICRYNPNNKTFTQLCTKLNTKNCLSNNNVRAIYEDEEGIIWIGTVAGGLNKYDPKTKLFSHYYTRENDPQSINDNRIYSIIGSHDGYIWLGTGNGVAKLNPKDETFERYTIEGIEGERLSHHLVMGVTEDHQGNIWAATYGGGVNKIDPKTKSIKIYNENDGLANNVVYAVLEDKNHKLWMSTNQGISAFDPTTENFINYGIEDGLQEGEFNAGAYYKSITGELYFGGINGLNVINPEKIRSNEYIPPLLVSNFQIFNKTIKPFDLYNGERILSKSILETDTIRLNHKQNVLTLNFTILDFANPEKYSYSYMLDNFEKDWNEVEKRRYATYTNLPAGTYVFHVRSSNSSGTGYIESKPITFIITPPWWKTTLFYILAVAFIGLMILLYNRNRLYLLRKEKNKLEKNVLQRTAELREKNKILQENELKLKQANATKDKFFSIIAHDLKNPFNIILGYADILDKEYSDFNDNERIKMIGSINKASKSTYKLLDNLLTWSRSQQGKIILNKENLNLADLVNASIEAFLSSAKSKGISIKMEVDNRLIIFGDRYTLMITIGNIFNNATKFTHPGGQIIIKTIKSENKIKVQITDNGVGIAEEDIDKLFRIDESLSTPGTNNEKGTGLGLILCKEFIEMNDGKIEVKSKVGKGSTFTLIIPAPI